MEQNLDGQSVVRVLDFPENFRSKWSMYIDNESGCLREIIDNATDESYACRTCNDIFIDTNFNGWNVVADSGRGIPIFMSPDRPEQTQADVSISVAHAGSKFKGTGMTKTGTFGLGSSIVNALSEDYVLLSIITEENHNQSIKPVYDLWSNSGPRSKRDLYYIVWYKKGYKYYEGAHKKADIEKQIFGSKDVLPSGYSSIVLFKPDPEIFGKPKTEVPVENLRNFALIQEKFYKRKVNLHINGTTINSSGFVPYRYEILKTITPADTSQNKSIGVYLTFEIDDEFGPRDCYGSVNGLKVDSGIHIQYMESCYDQALKAEYKIKHKTIFNGLKMFVLVLADEISYDSQTKVRLKSITKVKLTDFADIVKEFQKIFRKDSEYWENHVGKLNFLAESMKSLSAVEKAQKIIDSASGNSMYRSKAEMIPGFSDATAGHGNRWDCELFLCFTGDTKVKVVKGDSIFSIWSKASFESGWDNISFYDLEKEFNSSSSEGMSYFTMTTCEINDKTRYVTAKPSKILAVKKIDTVEKLAHIKIIKDCTEHIIKCTPDHKFLVKKEDDSFEYVEAQSLVFGNNLVGVDDFGVVVGLDIIDCEPTDVYCLEVSDPEHNFLLSAGVFSKNCEGLSAAGSLKQGRRSTQYHAILPLRGKVKNVSEVDANTMMENKEFYTIFRLIGLGIDENNVTHSCKTVEEAMEKIKKHARYGKIILNFDEDSDGSQIRSGMLYAIAKFARFMLDAGMIYYSMGPLFKQNNKFYFPTDIKPGEYFPGGDFDPKKPFLRYKGLGGLNKMDVYDAYFNPATRRLVQVTTENIEYAMSLVEDINQRKNLLYSAGILSNPYGFNDL